MNRSSVSTLIVLVLAAVGLGATASELHLRDAYRVAHMDDPGINTMILYNRAVVRTPDTTLRYRKISVGEIIDSADAPLNNLGLFSHHDYGIGADRPDGLRIAVIGGEQTASSISTTSWPDYLQAELRRRLRRADVYVYNIGWPDAGPEHYIKYWKEFGEAIDPHLTIVNIVETDYYRDIKVSSPSFSYLGQPFAGYAKVAYPVGDGAATNASPYIGEKPADPADFRDPSIVPSRPYGFLAPDAAMRDAPALVALQRRVAADMIEGTVKLIGCFACKVLLGPDPFGAAYRVGALRAIRSKSEATATAPEKRQLAAFGARVFGWMAETIPNLLLTHNFGAHELAAAFSLTAEMARIAPHIEVVDMRKRLPDGTTAADIAPWYKLPYMPEKWSDAGHRAYAGMIADLILERGLAD